MFDYRAVVVSVVDGDTIHVDLHLGFEIWQKNATIRLTGINAPELNATDPTIRASAVASRNALLSWLPTGTKVTMLSQQDKTEKFGRLLGTILVDTATGPLNLNDWMVTNGFAVPYLVK